MSILEIVRTALESLSTNKLRTLLTMLGVIIGVGSVVTLLAIGEGVSNNITSRIATTGTNLLTISADNRAVSGARLTTADIKALSSPGVVPEVLEFIPSVNGNTKAIQGTNVQNVSVNGTTPAYFSARSLTVDQGRLFTQDDIDARTRVAVLGSTIASELFPNAGAVGQTIIVGNVPFKVAGVTAASGGAFGNSPDDTVFVPITVAQEKLFANRPSGLNSVSQVTAILKSSDTAASTSAQTNISSILRQRHKLISGQADDFRIFNQAQLADTLNSVATTLTLFLGAIGAISLVVGGIGIMNIMLVSVTERTREIGVRKAIGARRGAIRLQFLIEALTVTVIAGLIGIVVGVGISALVGSAQASLVPIVNTTTLLVAFGVSVFVGVIFGLYPAWRASLLSPVAFGTFVRRDGNTVEIHPGFFGRRGQGNGQGNNQANAAGPAPTPAPPIDITVDSSTKIYRDTTKVDPAAFQSGQTIQQTVEKVDSLDALKLDSNSILQAWGDLSGGKMTARVLVYTERQPRPKAQARAQQTQP